MGKSIFSYSLMNGLLEVQDKVWAMLQTPPLTEFLTLSSYAPAHTEQLIPMATNKPQHLTMQAA